MSSVKLAEFQSAAVETICERLTDTGGSRRFLLADEVGLGKTVVARGVIEELIRRRRGRELVVVYLCSNSEIADQNRTKLAPNAPPSLRRITQLAWSASNTGKLQLYSFTPGTSLSEGTGLAWERQLLLFLAHRVLRQDIRKGKWREYFRCGAREERWKAGTRFRGGKRCGGPLSHPAGVGIGDHVATDVRMTADWRDRCGAGLPVCCRELAIAFRHRQLF